MVRMGLQSETELQLTQALLRSGHGLVRSLLAVLRDSALDESDDDESNPATSYWERSPS